jgi:PhnB protein
VYEGCPKTQIVALSDQGDFMATQPKPTAVQPVPSGYQTVTPFLFVDNTPTLIEFLKKAFDAKETFSMNDDSGTPGHAELKVGTSMVMVGRARGEWKPLPCAIYLYVQNVDDTFKKAIAAGGKVIQEVKNQFYGDRSGGVQDPSGNYWWIATHVEDVSMEELNRRHQEMLKKATSH